MMQEQPAPAHGLWKSAPLWRYCCYTGAGLTILAAALPYMKQAEPVAKETAAAPVKVEKPAISYSVAPGPTLAQNIAEKKTQHLKPAIVQAKPPTPVLKKKDDADSSAHVPAKMVREQVADHPLVKTVEASPPSPSPVSSSLQDDPAGILAELDSLPKGTKDRCMSPQDRVPSKSTKPGATEVHLASEGVWCFFESNSQLYSIRMDGPFAGTVGGIRIGDSLDKVKAVFGTPVRDWPFAGNEAYLFNKGPKSFERFDIGDGVVRTIFVGKR